MSPLPLQRLRSSTWRYALLGGLASLPVTLALNWQDLSGVQDASGVVLAALAVGYLAKRRALESTQVGLRAGAIGALPMLWSVVDLVPFVLGLAQPGWFTAVQLALLTVTALVLVGFTALLGGLAGLVGGWLAERRGHPRRPVAGV